LPKNRKINTAVIHHKEILMGLEFFDAKGALILKVGKLHDPSSKWPTDHCLIDKVELADNERIIGMSS